MNRFAQNHPCDCTCVCVCLSAAIPGVLWYLPLVYFFLVGLFLFFRLFVADEIGYTVGLIHHPYLVLLKPLVRAPSEEPPLLTLRFFSLSVSHTHTLT